MQRIVTYTRLNYNGDELIINGLLKAEFQRLRELDNQKLNNVMQAYERERDFRDMRKNINHDKLKEKYAKLKADDCKRCNKIFLYKAKETIIFIWGCMYYLAEKWNLVKYEYVEGVWKRK